MPRNKDCAEPHGPSRKSPLGAKTSLFANSIHSQSTFCHLDVGGDCAGIIRKPNFIRVYNSGSDVNYSWYLLQHLNADMDVADKGCIPKVSDCCVGTGNFHKGSLLEMGG